jgi:hypothetical protein
MMKVTKPKDFYLFVHDDETYKRTEHKYDACFVMHALYTSAHAGDVACRRRISKVTVKASSSIEFLYLILIVTIFTTP